MGGGSCRNSPSQFSDPEWTRIDHDNTQQIRARTYSGRRIIRAGCDGSGAVVHNCDLSGDRAMGVHDGVTEEV